MNRQLRHGIDDTNTAWRASYTAIVALTCGLNAASAAAEKIYSGKFVRIEASDNITIQTTNGAVSARLEGVALPVSGQPGYDDSRALLRELVRDRSVTAIVRTVDNQNVMRLSVEGTSINRELIRLGGAWHDHGATNSAALAAAEREARDKRSGLWAAAAEPVAPWKWAEHQRELVAAEVRMRVAKFRKSLDVSLETRAAALAALDRTIDAMGGADSLKRLERAQLQGELRCDFARLSGKNRQHEVITAPLDVAWQLPDHFYAAAMFPEFELFGRKDQFGVRAVWNRPRGLAQRVIISNGTESHELVASIPEGAAGEQQSIAIAMWLGTIRDLLTLSPLTDEKRYAVRAVPVQDDKDLAARNVIEFYPRHFLDLAEERGDAALLLPWRSQTEPEWFQIEFDSVTKLPARWRAGDFFGGHLSSEKPAAFGPLTVCTEWSLRDSNGEEYAGVTIKSVELPEKLDPQLFAVSARTGK